MKYVNINVKVTKGLNATFLQQPFLQLSLGMLAVGKYINQIAMYNFTSYESEGPQKMLQQGSACNKLFDQKFQESTKVVVVLYSNNKQYIGVQVTLFQGKMRIFYADTLFDFLEGKIGSDSYQYF